MKKRNIILIALAIIVLGVITFMCTRKKADNSVKFEQTKVEQTSISTSVTATGTLEAVTTVDVGTQVSGKVTKLYVDYNSVVKKGQIIAELDRTTLESDVESQLANVRSAQSELLYQKKNYARYAELHQKQLVSEAEYDVALESYRKAQEAVKVSQQSLAKSRTNLGYATVYSPIDGVVISKKVEVGQTVAASFSTPTLFSIANDLKDMQVVADVDEADIGNVKEGQRVEFTVDSYPDETFSGTVKQVRQNATTTNNVVTYEVVISARNNDLKLKPGMTANVTIFTLERDNVTSVKSAALRFTPDAEVIGKKYKVKDINASHKLWTLEGNTFVAHKVEIGITDGKHTEITSGINLGESVVLDVVSGAMAQASDSTDTSDSSPFMPGPKNKNSKKTGSSSASGSSAKSSGGNSAGGGGK
jgi:HlyD family secretion protein